MARFRDRVVSRDSERRPESAEYGGGSQMQECAHALEVCSDGRQRPVREPEAETESTVINRPGPYPMGTRSEPGQHY